MVQPETLQTLFSENPGLIDIYDEDEDTALHLATQESHADTVQFLLEAKANTRMLNSAGVSALFCSLGERDDEGKAQSSIMQIFLDHGVSLKGTNSRGFSLLHPAAGTNDLPHIQLLLKAKADIEHGTPKTPLYHAAKAGRMEALKLLIECKASVNGEAFKSQQKRSYKMC